MPSQLPAKYHGLELHGPPWPFDPEPQQGCLDLPSAAERTEGLRDLRRSGAVARILSEVPRVCRRVFVDNSLPQSRPSGLPPRSCQRLFNDVRPKIKYTRADYVSFSPGSSTLTRPLCPSSSPATSWRSAPPTSAYVTSMPSRRLRTVNASNLVASFVESRSSSIATIPSLPG